MIPTASVKTIALLARPKKEEAITVARELIAAFPDHKFLVERWVKATKGGNSH